jgi:hypothetical protein
MNFNTPLFVPVFMGIGLLATACLGGNAELVERKATELRSISEQVTKQAAPAGLKEGDQVEIKATVRVERVPEQAPVIQDVKIESVAVTGKTKDPGVAEKKQTEGPPDVRQERLDVPSVNVKGEK